MSVDNRGNCGPQAVPVYTIYSGGYHSNVNYGFHHNDPQAPPPKYEDVVNGRNNEQRPPAQPIGAHEGAEPAGVIFVAPVYKYTKVQKTIGLIFTILFFICFFSVLGKVLNVR